MASLAAPLAFLVICKAMLSREHGQVAPPRTCLASATPNVAQIASWPEGFTMQLPSSQQLFHVHPCPFCLRALRPSVSAAGRSAWATGAPPTPPLREAPTPTLSLLCIGSWYSVDSYLIATYVHSRGVRLRAGWRKSRRQPLQVCAAKKVSAHCARMTCKWRTVIASRMILHTSAWCADRQ